MDTSEQQLLAPSARRDLVAELLPGAAERGELALAFQPIVDVASGDVVAHESLLRWCSPVLGNVPPDEALGVADRLGLLVELDTWVIGEALERRPSLAAGGELWVNVSARSLEVGAGLVETVAERLRRSDSRVDGLVIEVTESIPMADLTAARLTVTGLRELGIGVALDDFGSDANDFQRLLNLPFDHVKIDRQVTAATSTSVGRAVVSAAVAIAESCGVGLVLEGIEQHHELATARALRVPRAQGYLLGRPRLLPA